MKEMTPWQRFVNMLELDRRDIRQILFYAIFAGLVALTLPLGIQAIINLIQGAQVSTSWIILVILVTIGVAFQGILQLMQVRILENIQQKIFTRSSFEFAYRFPKLKMSELHNYYPPELANRFFDTLTVQKGLSKILLDFPAAILQIVFGLILLSFYHPFFIIYGFLLVLLVYLVFKFTAKKGLETSLAESKNKYKVAHWLQEVARSLVSFKLSGRTSLALNRNNYLTESYLESREKHFKVLLLQLIQMIGFKVLVTAGLLLIGGLLVLNQQMNIGQFVAAEIIILLVISSVEKLITGLESFYDVLTSLEKIGQVVDKKMEAQGGSNPFEVRDDATIHIDHVSYATPETGNILKDINLDIYTKDRLLITGLSGSGKSTLLKLLSGVIEPTAGNIFINDFSFKGMHPNSYRSQIGQVLPEQSPFEGTILENISFGNSEITTERIFEVIQQVGLQPFIRAQVNGLQTILFPEGQQIPHTISKRILLARAIVHEPKILMLKDALEHFEANEARSIMNYLASPDRPWLLIVTSNNQDWEKVCTRHIILERGTIISKNN
ncbi:ATP-binding cassette domain-containing protein [Dokdonia sinensis]|uniref:ATP-binding cassette domain-containing protein n=1 Tax=Dokdonia sinensis TaxID=2479847 RepID=A0A3M0GDV8_9FLAO|nr:ATP-binding cassette domain-containing protein [Dokdonia sinensis]RMB62910.1 ATP-binding cassette domain-containing protein [Dokdonia sinensis]